jgi:DNA repair exonuclease SbcCD ATPase subunit
MITLQKLTWNNCFSYGANNELNLTSSTLTQIIGTNGMGKSSIPLIIEEALFNKNSKGIKKADIPNRYVNKGYNISLTFKKDKDIFKITVDRKTSIKVKLEKNGEDLSSHTSSNTYKTIQKIVGVDFKTFSQLVYQNTNASLQFLTATDTNRKKFLIDLLQLEKYLNVFEIFKEIHKETSSKKIAVASKLQTVQKWLENNILEDSNILPMLNLEIDTSKDEKELRSLMVEFENISEKNKKIIKNNQYKKLLKAINIQELQSSDSKYKEYGDILSLSGEYESEIKREQAVVDKLTKLGQECPTCNQKISYNIKQSMITEAATKVKIAEGARNDLKERIKSIKTENAEYKRVQASIKDWEDLFRSIDNELPSAILDKGELEVCMVRLRNKLQESKREISRIASENERRTKHNTRIQIINEQTESFLNDLKLCEEELKEISSLESYLEILKKSFSTNGLIAYKIETLVKELEILTNKYLAELSDGRFTLEFIVTNDKLNVQITDNANIVDILSLSSGELARVNTSTLVAIRRLMSSISKSKINVLFLDEVINVLDDVGKEKLVEVLQEEKELNTFIVSHGWTHPLLDKLEVLKEGNVSRLE